MTGMRISSSVATRAVPAEALTNVRRARRHRGVVGGGLQIGGLSIPATVQGRIFGQVQIDLIVVITGDRAHRDVVVGREEEPLLDDDVPG